MPLCSDKRNLLNVYQYPDPLQPVTATGPIHTSVGCSKNALRQIHPSKVVNDS